jgi:DNA topoisomerase-1
MPSVLLDGKCPKCGADLVAKTGRYGRFAACSNYPECKHTEAFPIGMKCPREGCTGQVVEKVTKRMKVFYGCGTYPACEWASWDKPAEEECPSCGNSYLVHKSNKTRGDFLRCPKCKEEFAGE